MNERINFQDLTDLLSKKQNLTKKESELFLRELVAVISENIEKKESVKIKDFGVFKLVKVNVRKSVDVNTGESIEIAAHYKLSFVPDKSLKEAVNRPFAHFESVVLEEGVSFDNIESEAIDDEVDGENPEPDTNNEIVENSLIDQDKAEDTPNEKDLPSVVSDKSISLVLPQFESLADMPSTSLKEDSSKEDSESIESEDQAETVSSEFDGSNDQEPTDIESVMELHKRKSKRRRFISLGFIIFLIIAGFAIGGYYFQELVGYFMEPPIQNTIAEKNELADNKEAIAPLSDTVAVEEAQKIDTIVSVKDTLKAINLKPVEKVKEKSKPNVNNPLATLTIERGHTLRNIALKYYGNKSFWVYIYEENKGVIKNPNNVPIGTKLIIPAPEKYGIDPKDTSKIKLARQAETKIIRAMGL